MDEDLKSISFKELLKTHIYVAAKEFNDTINAISEKDPSYITKILGKYCEKYIVIFSKLSALCNDTEILESLDKIREIITFQRQQIYFCSNQLREFKLILERAYLSSFSVDYAFTALCHRKRQK